MLSKYVLGLIINAGAIGITLLFLLAFSQQPMNENFPVLLAAFCICQVLQGVILPIMFKMGVEKGRMVMMAVLLVPTLLIMMGNNFFNSVFNEQNLRLLAYASPVLIVLTVVVSVLVSLHIYRHKEF